MFHVEQAAKPRHQIVPVKEGRWFVEGKVLRPDSDPKRTFAGCLANQIKAACTSRKHRQSRVPDA
jgi:hypothetical protein